VLHGEREIEDERDVVGQAGIERCPTTETAVTWPASEGDTKRWSSSVRPQVVTWPQVPPLPHGQSRADAGGSATSVFASIRPSERIAANTASARARCFGSVVALETLRSPPRMTRAP